jgi:hypothetical protein
MTEEINYADFFSMFIFDTEEIVYLFLAQSTKIEQFIALLLEIWQDFPYCLVYEYDILYKMK